MNFAKLAPEYASLWDGMTIVRLEQSIARTAVRIIENRTRYEQIEALTRVPWYVVGIIHAMETGLRFDRHLHNGDPLTHATKLVPAGRPRGNGPFTFEQSCQDALCMKGYDKLTDWTIERICWALENYNGWGYRKHHPDTLSPYLWSGTGHYTSGKYVADGKWSKTAVSSQAGAMALLGQIMKTCDDVRPVSMFAADATAPEDHSPASFRSTDKPATSNAEAAVGGTMMIGSGLAFNEVVSNAGQVKSLFAGADLTTWGVPALIIASVLAVLWWASAAIPIRIASLKGAAILIGMALLAGWGWLKWHDVKVASAAVKQERASVDKQGAANAGKAKTAGKHAASDADRVLKHYCRDC